MRNWSFEETERKVRANVVYRQSSTEVIRKGKASKPTEFGKMVKIQEAENQIITHYEVFDKRPPDAERWWRQCTSMKSNSDVFHNW